MAGDQQIKTSHFSHAYFPVVIEFPISFLSLFYFSITLKCSLSYLSGKGGQGSQKIKLHNNFSVLYQPTLLAISRLFGSHPVTWDWMISFKRGEKCKNTCEYVYSINSRKTLNRECCGVWNNG